jgi:hypothetical protein
MKTILLLMNLLLIQSCSHYKDKCATFGMTKAEVQASCGVSDTTSFDEKSERWYYYGFIGGTIVEFRNGKCTSVTPYMILML